MVHSVELLFDLDTEAVIRRAWDDLRDAGIAAQPPAARPHATLCVAQQIDEAVLADSLFGARPAAEAVIAEVDGAPAGFALFFHNFSTFHGRRGLYLEDLYVRPAFRARGIPVHMHRDASMLMAARCRTCLDRLRRTHAVLAAASEM